MPDRKDPNEKRPPRPSRPTLPEAISTPPRNDPSDSFATSNVNDDLVMIPAPSPEQLAKPRATATHPKRPGHSHGLRRTIIPILLTYGVFLPVLGILWFTLDDSSPFRRLGPGLAIGLIGFGAILLLGGLLNVLHIKHLQSNPGPSRRV